MGVTLVHETHARSFTSTLLTCSKGIARYCCSKSGLQDIAAASCIAVGARIIHELAPNLTARLLFGKPLDIATARNNKGQRPLEVIAGDNHPPIARRIACKLFGFNPKNGYARFIYPFNCPDSKIFATLFAGPVFGIAYSTGVLALLKKCTTPFYITKAVSLLGLFNHTFGSKGLFMHPHTLHQGEEFGDAGIPAMSTFELS